MKKFVFVASLFALLAALGATYARHGLCNHRCPSCRKAECGNTAKHHKEHKCSECGHEWRSK